MDSWKVFYAWQSDLPRRYTRDFIRSAVEAAIAEVEASGLVDDSPRLDHDTEGIAGCPDIAGTIYSKIDRADIFLADVSLIGATDREVTRKGVKLVPNPNVMMELGYAARSLGWDRLVLVMNKKFGEPDQLPFDLRNRRFPLTFHIDERERNLEDKRRELGRLIASAISMCLQTQNDRVSQTIAQLDIDSIDLIRKHGRQPLFWTTRGDGKGIPVFSPLSLSVPRLLELGLICCTRIDAENRYVYRWTRLGVDDQTK